MKINKTELQSALEKVRPGLAQKEIIEQSTSFAFMEDKVITYNDEISISHPVKDLDVTGAVKAQELYQFLSKVKKDEIDIEWEDNQVKITAGKSKAGLIFQDEVKLPIDEVGDIGKWKDLPKGFLNALKFCKTSCSKNMSRPVLTCVNVSKDGAITSSDGYRVTIYNIDEMPVESFLIPASSVNELVKYSIKQVAEGTGWVHFKTEDNTVFSCRIFQDNFPEVSGILEFDGREITLPENMSEALDRAQVFAKADLGNDTLVSINIENTKMTVSVQSDSGWFEETMRIRYKDEPINFQAHPLFLSEMLNKVKGCVIGEDRMKFRGENWVYVVALTAGE